MSLRAVELFAGAGGLAMGVSLAGFESLKVVEWDKWACDTVRENQRRGLPLVSGWPLEESDVRDVDWEAVPKDIELLAGGPPCQPFSMGGKHMTTAATCSRLPCRSCARFGRRPSSSRTSKG
jgi:DNA (cytosine-5)-methyltransferase 1